MLLLQLLSGHLLLLLGWLRSRLLLLSARFGFDRLRRLVGALEIELHQDLFLRLLLGFLFGFLGLFGFGFAANICVLYDDLRLLLLNPLLLHDLVLLLLDQ